MSTVRKVLLVAFGVIILMGSAAFAGFFLGASRQPFTQRYSLPNEAQQYLEDYFIDELPDQVSLERGMVRGMVEVLGDPHTAYFEPASQELMEDNLSGEYGGVGAYLTRDTDGTYYLIPFEGGPAAEAGVLEGDILLAVDGQQILPETSQDLVLSWVRGPVGTKVRILIRTPSNVENQREVVISREIFAIPSVTHYTYPSDPAIGVIAISRFSDKTQEEVSQAYDALGDLRIEALVLDLRDNSGGLLDSGVAVAEFFLTEGTIIVEHRLEGDQRYQVESRGVADEIPLTVIVNGGTASAAEVVAAALQDNQRAPLIGWPTFGKGSVQAILNLSDGSSLHITTARWETPRGVILDDTGLDPDILVAQDLDAGDAALIAAVDWISAHRHGMDEKEDE
jgi:carboxyl-terminal processing protease